MELETLPWPGFESSLVRRTFPPPIWPAVHECEVSLHTVGTCTGVMGKSAPPKMGIRVPIFLEVWGPQVPTYPGVWSALHEIGTPTWLVFKHCIEASKTTKNHLLCHGVLLGRPTWCCTPFLPLILLFFFFAWICPFEALMLCHSFNRGLLQQHTDTSDIFLAIATPEFYTLLPTCPVCLMLSFLGQHPFCHLPSPALRSLIVRKVFGESSLLAYTHTGYI